eukprot:TRINITY_DN70015_c0_g1_i1.p1 TRINITY_DN70015_c0_g1~~TRINITY_DN70015_c0_g1_i1.p1  ORF type:complete len:367 (+),score=56.45 TRINITY_DN70015_c0_g1_i1:59-1159(+)
MFRVFVAVAAASVAALADSEADTCPAGGCAPEATSSGLQLPRIIIGCWQLLERNPSKEDAVRTLLAYADAGFTAFDTADIYGKSETILGLFRKRWAVKHDVSPLRFFTKYVTDDPSVKNANRINARSLRDMGVDAADMVQFHWWSLAKDGSRRTFLDAGRQLTRLKQDGRIKHLAGCNMDTTHLRLLVEDGMAVEANQVQFSLLDRRAEVSMLPYCREQGIKITAFGVVAGGLLSDSFLGVTHQEAQGKLDSVSRNMYMSSLRRWSEDWDLFQTLLRTLQDIGQSKQPRQKIADVACLWALQRMEELGAGGALILGVRDTGHLAEHAALLSGEVQLTPEDMSTIQVVLARGNPPRGDIWHDERGWA